MSDITPKVKLYIFLSIITLIINLGSILVSMITKNSIDLSLLVIGLAGIGSSFIPFVSLINLALLNMPTEIFALLGLFTSIISSVQALIIGFMILQVVHNIIWNPDV